MKVLFRRIRRKAKMIITGPPCPPWSRQGKRRSWEDKRAAPFKHAVKHIQCQANMHGSQLKCFIMENVDGLLDKINNKSIKKKSAAKKPAAKKHILTSSKKRKHLDDVMDLFYMGEDKLDKKETTTTKRDVYDIKKMHDKGVAHHGAEGGQFDDSKPSLKASTGVSGGAVGTLI